MEMKEDSTKVIDMIRQEEEFHGVLKAVVMRELRR